MRRYIHTCPRQARIGVIGAGNSGICSISRLLKNNYYHADFILVDTDKDQLHKTDIADGQILHRILLADQRSLELKSRKGTKGNLELGTQAAMGSITRLQSVIRNYDLLFLVGGMGGGTATTALPVIAEAAAELDIMTVAIVTTPFGFEGSFKQKNAHHGIIALNSLVDTLIVLHGDQLLNMIEDRLHLDEAWSQADNLRHRCIHIIEQLTQYPGIINIDFADVKAVMEGNGTALMTMGVGYGENKVADVVKSALHCNWLERSAAGAGNVLMHIVTPPNHDFFEVADIAQKVTEEVGEQADIIWGVSEDTCLHDEVRILMVATGFCEITQIAHSNSVPMREAITETRARENRERYSLADHFWSMAREQISNVSRRWV